ncbi:DUF7668 domain-containing protein [Labilithrix luteola]|nr:hypothetical protein [Labilithrix luteola]
MKDENSAHPIASVWRPVFREVVNALVHGDYELVRRPSSVAPVSAKTVDQIQGYVTDYGETLAELPDETWRTSVSHWMGTYWQVLIDLWTIESGASDLVLDAWVFETEDGFRFEINSVYVP